MLKSKKEKKKKKQIIEVNFNHIFYEIYWK